MPQCIVRYWQRVGGLDFYLDDRMRFTPYQIKELGVLIRPLIASACSAEEGVQFTENDVEWLPTPHSNYAVGVPSFSIELRTIGFSERKAKLNREGTLDLKAKIAHHLPQELERGLTGPWLWVQWIDPDGHHV